MISRELMAALEAWDDAHEHLGSTRADYERLEDCRRRVEQLADVGAHRRERYVETDRLWRLYYERGHVYVQRIAVERSAA